MSIASPRASSDRAGVFGRHAPTHETDVVVIGAGQAGLSAAYHLKRLGAAPGSGFVVLDGASRPGGAWQHRWDSLTLSTVNRIHDLPGMAFADALEVGATDVRANVAVPRYFGAYEEGFELPVVRPVRVESVHERDGHFVVSTDRGELSAGGLVNATGTWEAPYVPRYPGAERFTGRQLHTRDYRTADAFTGQHVIVVGGRRAVAQVEHWVRRGLPPASVVSVTGLPVTPTIESMRGCR